MQKYWISAYIKKLKKSISKFIEEFVIFSGPAREIEIR